MSQFESYAYSAQPETPEDEAALHVDNELAARIKAGDNDAFAELWDYHAAYAAGTALKKGASENDREDMVQETALKLWLDLRANERDFSGPQGARSYVGRLAANTTVSNWRKAYNQRTDLVDDFHDTTGQPGPSAEQVVMSEYSHGLARDILENSLATIAPERVAALKATYLDDETREEYSQRTGTPTATIGSRTNRAKAELRKHPDLRAALDLLNEAS